MLTTVYTPDCLGPRVILLLYTLVKYVLYFLNKTTHRIKLIILFKFINCNL